MPRFELVPSRLPLRRGLAIVEISAALGYSESSPFVRAFKRWSGRSPMAWRLRMKPPRAR